MRKASHDSAFESGYFLTILDGISFQSQILINSKRSQKLTITTLIKLKNNNQNNVKKLKYSSQASLNMK